LESGPAHQARHSMAAIPLARVPQIFPDAWTADDPIMVNVQRTNPCE
jgi:hypothetical protein